MVRKNALVTGVSQGLGHALASCLLEAGYRVFGLSRKEPRGFGTAGERFRFYPFDLWDFEGIGPAVDALLDGETKLDLVLLNAGVLGGIKLLKETSKSDFNRVFDLNVWSNKVLVDHLLTKTVGQVIAISSGASVNGSGGWGAYAISKAALNLLIRVYAHEYPDTHFIALAPGVVDTAMVRGILAQGVSDARCDGLKRLRGAKERGAILAPEVAAGNILEKLPEICGLESGEYVDIRHL